MLRVCGNWRVGHSWKMVLRSGRPERRWNMCLSMMLMVFAENRIFQLPWQRIVNSTEAVAASHETLAQKIDEDVERPLRDYSNKNRDLASMPVVQSDLAGLAKNMETAQKKVEKAKEKGPKGADKLASAIHAAEEVTQQWQSRAPFVFEQLQAVDEGRLNHLRDVLTQLGTHEADQVERCREVAESCLNALLNVETADEIKTFAAKVNGGRPVVARRQELSPSVTPTPAAAPPPVHDDGASQHSETTAPTPKVAPPGKTPNMCFALILDGCSFSFSIVPEPRHPLGGLKRLGTVMNSRRKSIAQPVGGSFFSDKKNRSPFASFKRGDSRDMQIPESPPPGADRPGTGQDSFGEPARESQDREVLGVVTPPSTEPQPSVNATNGAAYPETQVAPSAGAGISTHEVCRTHMKLKMLKSN